MRTIRRTPRMTRLVGFKGDRMRLVSQTYGNSAGKKVRCAWFRSWLLGMTLMGLVLAELWMFGCQLQTPSSSNPVASQNTPKSKLDEVAKRLKRAFELGQPSRLSGIRVEHSLSYQYREPSELSDDYQATVVIRTRTEDTLSPKLDRGGGGGQGSDRAAKTTVLKSVGVQDQIARVQVASRPQVAGEDTPPNNWRSTMKERRGAAANTTRFQEQQSFELVYHNDQWQLVSELDIDPERLWFIYAFQQ